MEEDFIGIMTATWDVLDHQISSFSDEFECVLKVG
jgi:hypothetical protein